VAIEKQEVKDSLDDEDNLLRQVKVRPKTPPYKDIVRNDNKEEMEAIDQRRRAIIMLQRLLRGRAK
jgi:hypothetical protein